MSMIVQYIYMKNTYTNDFIFILLLFIYILLKFIFEKYENIMKHVRWQIESAREKDEASGE